jgi:hypothetical protein
MTNELRCPHKLHGILVEADVVEVACASHLCGGGRGVVVRHRFRISTGKLLSTKRYKSPERRTLNGNPS